MSVILSLRGSPRGSLMVFYSPSEGLPEGHNGCFTLFLRVFQRVKPSPSPLSEGEVTSLSDLFSPSVGFDEVTLLTLMLESMASLVSFDRFVNNEHY